MKKIQNMASGNSANFQRVHQASRTVYTYNSKKNKSYSKRHEQTSKSILEVDHYQNALKKGLVNTEKQKILKEKKKVFDKKKK